MQITRDQIDAATAGNDWDLGNKVLYELCKKYPAHKTKSEIVAKIWLIGRSYAAAIERRKKNEDDAFEGDGFYLEKVAPAIMNSDIDVWISSLKGFKKITNKNLHHILSVHYQVTELFSDISGLNKRSLASKYLHFHCPRLFYIYDSRVLSALSHISNIVGRAGRSTCEADNEYRKVVEKCLRLREHVRENHNVILSPRELDNLLLAIEANA